MDKTIIAARAAGAVTAAVRAELERGRVILMVPGGSAARLLERIAMDLPGHVSPEQLTVTPSDERYGMPGHAASNWSAVEQAFGSNVTGLPVLCGKSLSETVTDWRQSLERLAPRATIVALLGVGSDGHIAGIKPRSVADQTDAPLVVGYQAEDFERITIARPFFALVHTAIVYAKGPDKHEVIQRLRTGTGDEPMYAIRLAHHYEIYYDET